MAEGSEQPPTKQVVKRVVKKKAVPAGTSATERSTAQKADTKAPTVRYGRPVSSGTTTAPKPSVRTRSKKSSSDHGAAEDIRPTRRVSIPKPSIGKPSIPKPSVSGLKDVAGSVGGGFIAVFRRIIAAITDAFWFVVDTVRSWRLPRWEPVPAALTTGVVVGLLAVALGRLALELFEWLRGVASGGGTWGTLTFVVVAFVAFVVGELMLSGFNVPNPRITSFLGVSITIVLILAVFLEESDSQMAIVILPALAATSFTVGHWLMAAAESGAESEV